MAVATPADVRERASGRASAGVVKIAARRRGGWLAYLREIGRFRDLLLFLVLRDIRVRYSQTVLGLGWSVLQPFLQMVLFSIFFGALAGIGSGNVPYPVFSLAAVVPWTYFNNSVGVAATSLISNAQLVSKIYFPRLLVPLAPIGAGIVDLMIGTVLLLGVMTAYGVYPGWGILMLPLLVVLLVACAAGVSLWLAALGVQYRDVRYVTPFFLQSLLFVTPIIYVVSKVPAGARPFYALNPLVGVISGFRSAMLQQGGIPIGSMLESAVVSGCLIVSGLWYFRRIERAMADIA